MDRFEHQNNSIIQSTRTEIQNYMNQVYGWMTVGLFLTAFVSWYAINNTKIVLYLANNHWISIFLVVLEFLLVLTLSFALSRMSPVLATSMFMLYSMLTGLTSSLILISYTSISVTGTFFITSLTFLSLSVYGYLTKRDLSGFSIFLFMSIIGLIILSIVNVWFRSSGFSMFVSYCGILIFSALTAYDTQKLKEMGNKVDIYNNEDNMRKYAIFGALTLYLDFINLFFMFLRILGDRR
ncbi:MAG: Bax inhibitor-1/YccA family protein [Arsenophonus sp.]|nr:MAG: Bax inhibitor-1/YccA family protein [Arsenophonus sp.]